MSSGSGYDLGTGHSSSDEGAFEEKKKGGIDLSGKIVLKAQFGDDIRRIEVQSEGLSFQALTNLMYRLFSSYVEPTIKLTIKYKDDEGDLVTVFDDEDLTYALSCSRILRLKVFPWKKEQAELTDLSLQLREMRDRLIAGLDLLNDRISSSISLANLGIDEAPKQIPSALSNQEVGARRLSQSSTQGLHVQPSNNPLAGQFGGQSSQTLPVQQAVQFRHHQQDMGNEDQMGNEDLNKQPGQLGVQSSEMGSQEGQIANQGNQIRPSYSGTQPGPELTISQGTQPSQMPAVGASYGTEIGPQHGNHQRQIQGSSGPTGGQPQSGHTFAFKGSMPQAGGQPAHTLGSSGYQVSTGQPGYQGGQGVSSSAHQVPPPGPSQVINFGQPGPSSGHPRPPPGPSQVAHFGQPGQSSGQPRPPLGPSQLTHYGQPGPSFGHPGQPSAPSQAHSAHPRPPLGPNQGTPEQPGPPPLGPNQGTQFGQPGPPSFGQNQGTQLGQPGPPSFGPNQGTQLGQPGPPPFGPNQGAQLGQPGPPPFGPNQGAQLGQPGPPPFGPNQGTHLGQQSPNLGSSETCVNPRFSASTSSVNSGLSAFSPAQPAQGNQPGVSPGPPHSAPPIGIQASAMNPGDPMGIQIGGEESRQQAGAPSTSPFNWQPSVDGRNVAQTASERSSFYTQPPTVANSGVRSGSFSPYDPPRPVNNTGAAMNPYSRIPDQRR